MLWAILLGGLLAGAGPPPSEVAFEQFNLGLAHFAEGRFDEAVAAFTASLAAAPPDSVVEELRYDLALSLFRSRRLEEALKALAEVPLARGRVLEARVLRSLGRHDDAFAAWEAARRQGGLDVASLWHLAQLYGLAGRYGESEDVLADLAAESSGDAALAVAVERGEALALAERWQGSFAALQVAMALAQGDPEVQSLFRDAQRAREEEGAEQAQTLVSVTCNLLRASERYQAAARELARTPADSPLSDEPLAVAVDPRPGPPPGPWRLADGALAAPGGRGLCAGDGRLVVTGRQGTVVYERDGGQWRRSAALPRAASDCMVADLDREGGAEIVLLSDDALGIVWHDAHESALPLPSSGAATALALVDYDLDGDADMVTVGPAGARLWRNNRDRTFTDATRSSGLEAAAAGDFLGVVATDLVGDGAAELYLTRRRGENLVLTGLQQEAVEPVDLGAAAAGPATFADLDHDGDLDLATGGKLLFRDGPRKWRAAELPLATGASRLGTADLDADGFPDLLVLRDSGSLYVARGTGVGRFTPWLGEAREGVLDVAVADFDGDGRLELALLLAAGEVDFLDAEDPAGSVPHRLAVDLRGTKDNVDALGSTLELWAGELWLHREIRADTHELGESGPRQVLGMGPRPSGQWLRAVWPNRTWASQDEPESGALTLEQSPDLVGSCPFLYAWDGSRFAFVTDLLGGAPLGLPVARGVAMPIDPEEYVLLDGGRLVEKDGAYELRITEELREVLYLDQVELLAVDHPAEVAVATDDGLRPPPFPPFRLYAAIRPRPPVAAVDHRGTDVLDRVTEVDGRYPDGFRPIAFQGYAEPHSLTLDFGEIGSPDAPFLLLTGGYYWSEADNLALSQATAVRPQPPRLEVADGRRWRTLLEAMPFPGGRSKTIAVDLAGLQGPGPLRLRISSNLRLYFDRILLATEKAPASATRLRALRPISAVLRWRGYSTPGEGDGRLPRPYDYTHVVPGRPFPQIEGFYTRYGDVLPLLEEADDALVVLHHGEEVALRFHLAEPPPPGWRRDFLVRSVGWDKDGDPNVAAGDTVEPLPFLGMRRYPYSSPERRPFSQRLRELDRRYRGRWISGN